MAERAGLMLVLPLPMQRVGGVLHLDRQALNGLRLWRANFGSVHLLCPVEDLDTPRAATAPLEAVPGSLAITALPMVYTPLAFLRALGTARRTLAHAIDRADHLQFAIGGLFGDWGAVAAGIAHARGRRFAVWTDRVEHQVQRFQARERTGPARLYRELVWRAMRGLERRVIGQAAVGLFHGMDCYEAYAGWSPDPQLVHDIHLGPELRIADDRVAAKLARADDAPLYIAYCGRAHPDKGVDDWIDTLSAAHAGGARFEASWYGDGPALDGARARAAGLPWLRFAGAVDHHEGLERLREADLLLFCHKTLESPRVLIEALVSGTPIVGYRSPYAADLVAGHGGGLLTPKDDVPALTRALKGLAADRDQLRTLIRHAAEDGAAFNDEAVFRHRSDLIKGLAGG